MLYDLILFSVFPGHLPRRRNEQRSFYPVFYYTQRDPVRPFFFLLLKKSAEPHARQRSGNRSAPGCFFCLRFSLCAHIIQLFPLLNPN